MAYQKQTWVNDVTDVDETHMNHIEDGIEKAYGVKLLAVTDEEPSECSVGDKYFNTTTNKIYDAVDTDTWDDEGYDAESGVFYVVFEEQAIYTYNGITLIGVGSSGAGGESLPLGVILAFGGSNAPEGYLLCNGQAVSRTQYSELFNIIGTTYGQGDGTTTFNVPNIKGKVLVGKDATDNDFYDLGVTGGEKTHQLTVNEMPKHSHKVYYTDDGGQGAIARINVQGNQTSTTEVGGNQAHNNVQPYIVVNFIIKAHLSAVNTSEVVNEHSTSETDVYSANYVNGELNKLKAYSLYNNTSGATGDIVLSDSVSNYEYIEIFYKNVDSIFASTKVKSPNGKTIGLSCPVTFTGGSGNRGLYAMHSRIIDISGTNINTHTTTSNGSYYGAIALWENGTATLDKTNYIYITQVIGYK